MMTPIVAAFVSGVACSNGGAAPPCAPLVTEVAWRSRRTIVRHVSACAGLPRIERLYSVAIEHGVVCIPLRSLIAGGGSVR
jgi:hypothetical protein